MRSISILSAILCLFIALTGCSANPYQSASVPTAQNNNPFVEVNGNQPQFSAEELTANSFEQYSPLDALGRCGPANACIGLDIMPTEERGAIGQIKPSGWQTVKYDHVDGKYLYNRCHLIGYQLTGENANNENLITGTRYMNTEGMLPFENQIADYVKNTNNHVRYRVTPIFEGANLVASGVVLEAKSIEDNGQGICFHVYCFNIQPGVTIDYATGKSSLANTDVSSASIPAKQSGSVADVPAQSYVLNRSSKKFHRLECSSVESMKPENREDFTGQRQIVIDAGYEPCKSCNP